MKTFFPHPLRKTKIHFLYYSNIWLVISSVLCSVNPPLEALNTIYFEIHFQIHEIDFFIEKKLLKNLFQFPTIFDRKKIINFLLCSSSMPSNGTRPPLWDPLLFFFLPPANPSYVQL